MLSEPLEDFLGREKLKRANAILDALLEEKDSGELVIVFCGIFSSGKSSLINMLLGQEFRLPTGVKPVTKCITRIRYGRSFEAYYIRNRHRIPLEKEQVKDIMTGKLELPEGCREIVLHMPAELLDSHMVFLDTPGFEDSAETDEMTRQVVRASDLAVLCCSAEHFGRCFEQAYLQELEESLGNFCVVVNQTDVIQTDEEYERLCNYVMETIGGRGQYVLRGMTEKTVFFTVGAGRYAELDGLDRFLFQLKNAGWEQWERLKAYAKRRKVSYGLKELLPEVEEHVRFGQDELERLHKEKEAEYRQEWEQYRRECRRIDRTLEGAEPKPKQPVWKDGLLKEVRQVLEEWQALGHEIRSYLEELNRPYPFDDWYEFWQMSHKR